MESKEPPSHEQTGSETKKDNNFEGRKDEQTADSVDDNVLEPAVSLLMSDEALRDRIDQIIDEKYKASRLHGISNNLLISALFTFILTGIVGQVITAYLTNQQLELTARRSFSDELNKIRIQKFGEVWERLDEDELAIDSLLKQSAPARPNDPDLNDKKLNEIEDLIHRDRVIISKNRFWLGEETYDRANGYLNTSIKYALNQIMPSSETDLSELKQLRDNAKQNILQTTCLFLEGELGSQSKCRFK